jgi:molybdopterin biosynthesis enzyme
VRFLTCPSPLQGELCLPEGTLVGPPEVGILASVGATRVVTFRKPLVAVMSTGDEIVEPGSALGHGQVWDSNRSTLIAAVQDAGANVLDLGIVKDQVRDVAPLVCCL